VPNPTLKQYLTFQILLLVLDIQGNEESSALLYSKNSGGRVLYS